MPVCEKRPCIIASYRVRLSSGRGRRLSDAASKNASEAKSDGEGSFAMQGAKLVENERRENGCSSGEKWRKLGVLG